MAVAQRPRREFVENSSFLFTVSRSEQMARGKNEMMATENFLVRRKRETRIVLMETEAVHCRENAERERERRDIRHQFEWKNERIRNQRATELN